MNDLPRDEHLQAALRHAPDAQAVPPAHLSAQILAAAHRAAAEPPARARRPGLFATPWRLGASGALATVALAGVLGLLWRGERPGPAAEAPAAAVTAPAAPAPVAEAAPAGREAASRDAAAQESARSERAREARSAQVLAERRTAQQRKAEAPPPAPPELARPQADAAPAEARMAAVAPPPPPPALRAAAPAPAAPAAAAMPAAAVPRPPAPWRAALDAGTAVQWQVDGQAWLPDGRWLGALAAQVQGRWQAAPGAAPAPGDLRIEWAGPPGTAGRLWLGEGRLLSCDDTGRCEAARLDAEAAAMLRRTLPR